MGFTDKYILSSDRISIHYKVTGTGPTAIIFVHGWLGNADWWNNQQEYFSHSFTVVQMDLAGHGKSGKSRQTWSSNQYAADIKAVTGQISVQKVVLVAHSMSGAYAVEASINLPVVKALILVDTLKDLDQMLSFAQAEEYMLTPYRKDFKSAVENMLPRYLFVNTTPVAVQKQLQSEFLKNDGELAAKVIEPLYKMDVPEMAKLIQVPVRAINSDYSPTNRENNRKYFRDFDFVSIHGTGHYPMLEKPAEFNIALEGILKELTFHPAFF